MLLHIPASLLFVTHLTFSFLKCLIPILDAFKSPVGLISEPHAKQCLVKIIINIDLLFANLAWVFSMCFNHYIALFHLILLG